MLTVVFGLAVTNYVKSSTHLSCCFQACKDKQLVGQIHQGHLDRPEYGQKRMALHLGVNHKRTERVMKLNQIRRPRGRRKPYYRTVSTTNHHYTNLVKDIPQSPTPMPHQIWVCDTSYFKFKGKFWYLVTIMDRTTRQILSSWVGKHHNAALTLQCIKQAIMAAGTLPSYFHTDQGKEFMAQAVTHYLELQGVNISVSKKASPWENGHQESFFGRFKDEFGDINRFNTDGELIEEIYQRIHYYNHDRIHTAIKMPPAVYAKLLSDNSNHTSKSAADFLERLIYLSDGKVAIVHSDNGSEFEGAFEKAINENHLTQIYSRVKWPKDNPCLERFNRTIQDEWLNYSEVGLGETEEANQDLTNWLIEYNFGRPHESLDYLTPIEYAHTNYFNVLPTYPASTL